ncbi:MAG: hypothetical protein JWO03_2594 [Bacteroidetes bacterium]|nr:hypothetical protein [Bacteroidota bacterium]
MEPLNEFELAILQKLVSDYPVIGKHVPYLRVKERKVTGTAMYISLAYTAEAESLDFIPLKHLSTKGYLKMDGLQDGLIDGTTVIDGRIDKIELMTYDEPWDGEIRAFRWEDKF